jgi:hypothetical protein
MKLGADNPKKTVGAVALFAAAILLFLRTFAGGGAATASSPSPKPASALPSQAPQTGMEPRSAAPAQRRTTARRGQKPQQTQVAPSFTASLDPRLRLDLLGVAEQTSYAGSGRNIFRAEAEPIPQPVAPAIKPPVQPARIEPAGPPPPPPPPPINLKFFGFATSEGEPKRVFLASGDDVFIAQEGDIVNRRYKIIRIGTNSVEVEDLLSNRRQSLPLTG